MLVRQIQDFIEYLRFERRFSPHTITAYQKDLEQFHTYLTKSYTGIDDLKEIRHYHIRSWLADAQEVKPLSAATRNRKLSSLNSFFKRYQQLGAIDKNPVRQLHSIRLPERLPVYLKPAESDFLLEEISFGEGLKSATDRLMITLLYSTGLRRQELVNLRENDVEKSTRLLRVLGKGNKERLIPVGPELIEALAHYNEQKRSAGLASGGPLLVLENGNALYPGYVYRVVKSYLSMVTTLKKRSPHVLRHTIATQLLNNGASIQAIKELLGHSSLAATQIYTHNDISKLKEIHAQRHPRG